MIDNISELSKLTRAQFEQECQSRIDHIYLGNNTVLCKVLGGRKIYVDSRDVSLAPHLIMDGFWESWITLAFAKIIRPGFTCVDLGANYGYYSILMSELAGFEGRTIAIEANPEVGKYLTFTSMLNGGRFEVVQTAASNTNGEVTLTVTEQQFGGSTIIERQPAEGTYQIKVPTVTIDELLEQKKVSQLDFIKIDVEGVEPMVLEGMKDTLKNNPRLQMIVEYSPCMYSDAQAYTEYLFSTFIVHEVGFNSQFTELSKKDMNKLLNIPGHTDLFLKVKR